LFYLSDPPSFTFNATKFEQLSKGLLVQVQPPKAKTKQGQFKSAFQFEICENIKEAPTGIMWPEVPYVYDPEVTDILELANASMSRAWIEGKREVKVGDEVRVMIELYNGRGERRTIGGDLVSYVRHSNYSKEALIIV